MRNDEKMLVVSHCLRTKFFLLVDLREKIFRFMVVQTKKNK